MRMHHSGSRYSLIFISPGGSNTALVVFLLFLYTVLVETSRSNGTVYVGNMNSVSLQDIIMM